MTGFVYAIQSGDHVKIGWSADPKKRLGQIATSCAIPARLLAVKPGTVQCERALHARFAEFRAHREWFQFAEPIAAEIAQWQAPTARDTSFNPIKAIRLRVFKITQAKMAAITGVAQGTVSRWETGRLFPSFGECVRIREAARRLGRHWDDRWFFEAPRSEHAA